MADDLNLLLRIKGDAAGGKAAIAETRAAVATLRTSFGSDFKQISAVGTSALGSITQSLSSVSNQIPAVGNAIGGLVGQLTSMSVASEGATTGIAAMAGPIGIAVVAIGAAVVGTASLAKGLFEVTRQAAEFQGKMFDLSQQTGVNVETLSALEILAKTTGGTIESIAQSLVIFQGKLDEAQDASSKAGQKFEELGISTNNTEEAFRDALSVLAQMPEGFHQTNEAAELFGRRGGKQVLAILKETNGDLDGAIRRFRDMGILISEADAKLADEFNDQLAVLGFQLRAIGATIGKEVLPVALDAIQKLSSAFKDNREIIEAVAVAAKVVASMFTDQLKAGIFVVTAAWEQAKPVLEVTAALYERIAKAVQTLSGGLPAVAIPGDIGSVAGSLTGTLTHDDFLKEVQRIADATLTAAKEAEKLRQEAAARTNKAIALSHQALEEITRVHVEDLERERDRDLKNIDEWETESLQIAHDHRVGLEAIYDEEAASVRKYIDNKADQFLALQEIEQKRTKAVNDEIRKRNEIEDKAQRQRDQLELNLNRQLAEIRDVAREGELARIKDALDRQAIVESEAIARELALLKDAHEQRLLLIDIELKLETTSATRKQELDNDRIKSEQEYTDEKKRLTQERIDAANREAAANAPGVNGVPEPGDVPSPDMPPPPPGPFDAWKAAFKGLREIGADAMADLAFGIGALVQNWVLLGEIGPKAVRKMVASVLAGVAAQAAVEAVYELAKGFAALFTNPAEAAAHFTAAAIFGSIAGVAAVAGRVVAGDAFQRASGDGSHGSQSTGGDNPKPTVTPVKEEWRPAMRDLVINMKVKGDAVIETLRESVAVNGPVRTLILEVSNG